MDCAYSRPPAARKRGGLFVSGREALTLGRRQRGVVDETGVAEQGRHDELLAAASVYRRLHEAQYRS